MEWKKLGKIPLISPNLSWKMGQNQAQQINLNGISNGNKKFNQA